MNIIGFKIWTTVITLSLTAPLIAKSADKKRPLVASYGEGSQFEIEQGMVDRIYKQALHETPSGSPRDSAYAVRPALSVLAMNRFYTENDYYKIFFSESVPYMYSFSMSLSQHLFQVQRVGIKSSQELSYSYGQGLVDVESTSGVDAQDNVGIQLMPVQASLDMDYVHPHFQLLRPEVFIGMGSAWVQQTGDLDGVEQSFWVPFSRYGLRIGIASGIARHQIVVSLSRSQDFRTEHDAQITQLDIGAELAL